MTEISDEYIYIALSGWEMYRLPIGTAPGRYFYAAQHKGYNIHIDQSLAETVGYDELLASGYYTPAVQNVSVKDLPKSLLAKVLEFQKTHIS